MLRSFLSQIWHFIVVACSMSRSFSVRARVLRQRRVLGEGGFGTVFEVCNVSDGRAYALKEIRAPLADVEREVGAHNAVRHENVVPLVDSVIEGIRGARDRRDADDDEIAIDVPGSPPRRRAALIAAGDASEDAANGVATAAALPSSPTAAAYGGPYSSRAVLSSTFELMPGEPRASPRFNS